MLLHLRQNLLNMKTGWVHSWSTSLLQNLLSIGRKAKQCNFKLILQHMSQLYLMQIKFLSLESPLASLPSSSESITALVSQQYLHNLVSRLYLDRAMNQLYLDKAVNQLYTDKVVNQQCMDRVGSQQCMDRVGSQPFTDRAGNQLCSDNILRNLPFLDKIVLVTDMHQRVNLLYSSKSTTIPTVTITNMLKQTSQLLSHLNPHISTPGDLHLSTRYLQPLILPSSQHLNQQLQYDSIEKLVRECTNCIAGQMKMMKRNAINHHLFIEVGFER